MTRSFVAIATAIALCPSVAMAQPVASAPPAAAAAPAPAPVAAEPAPAPAAPTTATAGPATVTATPAAPQAQAQPPATVNAPTNVAVTVNTSQAQAQSQEQPQPAPPVAAPAAEPTPTPPPPVVVQQTYAPGVEDHPVYGPRYRAASGVMFTGVGFLIAGPALLLTVTLPAYALQKNAVDNSHDASTLAWEERYLDRAYRRNMAMQVSGVTALVFTAVGLAMTVGGGVGRARARRAAERDYERRARVEPAAGGVVVRF